MTLHFSKSPKPKLPGQKLTAALLALASFAAPAYALAPDDIAVLYNTSSERSLLLAQYYMKARQIPDSHLIPITCLWREDITEADYREKVVPQVRRELAEKKLDQSIKCLVTTYDVPLKIGGWKANQGAGQELTADTNELNNVIAAMDDAVDAYDRIAVPAPPSTQSAATAPATTSASQPRKKLPGLAAELNKLRTAAGAAAQRLDKMPVAERASALEDMLKVHQEVTGIGGILVGFGMNAAGADAEKGWELRDKLQTELNGIEIRAKELNEHRDDAATRKELITLAMRAHGLIGKARELQENIGYLSETEACFDNELALVLADQNYPRGRWIINPQNVEVYSRIRKLTGIPKTLMVTRIDGSSVEKAEEMIDRGLKIERTGLDGKMYLDSRGRYSKDDPYAIMDIEMRDLSLWMKANTTMDVILDEKPALLLAKDCPACALYCGWYSLENYEDSCQWLPGAVGYHVASGEMISLHRPGESGWVVNLLNRGFCGTLGPTAEPYLSSFPNPFCFFPLLLSGEFTQGEVWQVTTPMLSWRQGYVGDPLYNPFKAHPRVKLEVLEKNPILRNAFVILRPEMKLDPTPQPATTPGAAAGPAQ